MSESLEGIAGLIEIGTVTVKSGSLMGEMDLTVEDRCVRIDPVIEVEYVGMNQIDAGILHL
jgi:hypothetical protein